MCLIRFTVRWVVVCLAGMLAVNASQADDFTWAASPATGNWNTNDLNWSGAGSVWTNGAANNAAFGASDTKSIEADAVTLNNLDFTADGYEITGGPLFMHGVPSVGASLSATIKAAITVTNSGIWTKSGAGTLVLDPGAGTNTLSVLRADEGTLHLAGGTTLATQTASYSGVPTECLVDEGTLVIGGGLFKTTAAGGTYSIVRNYGHLLITNGVCDLSGDNDLLNGFYSPGTTTVSGGGVLDVNKLRISQQKTNPADQCVINIDTGGVIRLSLFYSDTYYKYKGTVKFNGGTVIAKTGTPNFFSSGHTNWSDIVAKVMEGGAVVDSNGSNITIKHPLLSGAASDGGLTKLGSGILTLSGTNTFNGGTFIEGGSLQFAIDDNLGAVPDSPETNITFAESGTLQADASGADVHANRSISIASNKTCTVDSQTYTQTIYSAISGQSVLRKTGSGVTRLDPGDTS